MKNNRRILNHGGGKGDKSRVTNEKIYQANMAEVQFSGVPASADPAFEQLGSKSVKFYGVRATIPDVKLTGKPIIH
jgi:hypothetical protein